MSLSSGLLAIRAHKAVRHSAATIIAFKCPRTEIIRGMLDDLKILVMTPLNRINEKRQTIQREVLAAISESQAHDVLRDAVDAAMVTETAAIMNDPVVMMFVQAFNDRATLLLNEQEDDETVIAAYQNAKMALMAQMYNALLKENTL